DRTRKRDARGVPARALPPGRGGAGPGGSGARAAFGKKRRQRRRPDAERAKASRDRPRARHRPEDSVPRRADGRTQSDRSRGGVRARSRHPRSRRHHHSGRASHARDHADLRSHHRAPSWREDRRRRAASGRAGPQCHCRVSGRKGRLMLKVERLQAAYGKVQTLWEIGFEVPEGAIVALLGANGAGKTTTLKVLSGRLRPRGGSIVLDGERIDGRPPADIVRRGIVHVPEGRGLFPDMSVLDNLMMGAYATPGAGRRARLAQVFGIFPRLEERRGQLAGTLSGGEQQMVAIGRGLMAGPKLLMLDEPSLGLAPLVVEEMFRVVREINASGVTVLLVEQNTQHALALSDRGYVLEAGRVVLSGSGQQLLADANVRKAYLGL